jgi:hypothetical protein
VSNFLAIATVTETLTHLLQTFVSGSGAGSVPGASAMHLEPNSDDLIAGGPIVNVFLYRITRTTAPSNRDPPTRPAAGAPIERPRVAVNLAYLISFYGDQSALEPQRLLACVIAGLHAEPVLPPALISQIVASTSWLTGSDLADAPERVRFTALTIPAEELAWFWTSVAPERHRLSVAYEATGVELDWPGTVA